MHRRLQEIKRNLERIGDFFKAAVVPFLLPLSREVSGERRHKEPTTA